MVFSHIHGHRTIYRPTHQCNEADTSCIYCLSPHTPSTLVVPLSFAYARQRRHHIMATHASVIKLFLPDKQKDTLMKMQGCKFLKGRRRFLEDDERN